MTAAVLVAVIFFLLATLPPQPMALSLERVEPDLLRRTVRGAYHIHTTRSDGAEDKAFVAGAAARAGLNFAIFTEHDDGTRPPDPPAYINGVLCIDGVEISTNGGHYVALGMPAAPYPLGGEAAAVVEDVRRLGGFGIAAHPDSPKQELAWTDWDAPIDGIEWLSADSEWRSEGRLALTRTFVDYLLRPAPALASVLDRPERTLDRWDAASRTRRLVALAAVDAHGGAWAAARENAEPRVVVGPSYEASFKSLTNRVVLERPLTGDAAGDARAVLDAIQRGSVYSVVDAVSPDVVLDPAADDVELRSELPPGANVVTVREGGAHRREIRDPRSPGEPPVPWVLTNWVYPVGAPAAPEPIAPVVTVSGVPILSSAWNVEKDVASSGDVTGGSDLMTLKYELAPGERRSQFVGAATDLAEPRPFSAIIFRARASRPMRVSVQLRFRPNDRRWVKSVYLDPEEREIVVQAGEMAPAEKSSGPMPATGNARSLLFVVDLVNAKPGDRGELTISDVRMVTR